MSISGLAVEDSPFIVTMATRMLIKLGHHVESASNGSIGLEKLKAVHGTEADFDLVLCDFQMPVRACLAQFSK